MFGFDQLVLLRLVGFGFVAMGLGARFGLWKKWYWRSRGGAYTYLPLGVLLFLYTYTDLAKVSLGPYYFLFWAAIFLLAVFCLWWTVRTPAFVKPTWVRWVDKHPKRVIEAMADEVEAGEEWEGYIESEAKVDQWAKRLNTKLL